LQTRKARRARNPRTGARIDVPAKIVVKFTPAGALKRQAALTDVPKV
jgi:nucleoid DNA-binding protein